MRVGWTMTVKYSFEPDRGYRFTKEEISLLFHASARFRNNAVVTSLDLFHFFKALNRFLAEVGAYDHEKVATCEALDIDHFPNLTNATFYKFLPERSLQYYIDGSFQFGSVEYYRSIEQQNSRDRMEGLCNIALKTRTHLFGMSLASGYNFGIFCGTASLNKQEEMSERFGPRIIKISRFKEFAEEVKQRLNAHRFYFNHVRYNDLKMFRAKTLKSVQLSRDEPPENFDPSLINDLAFDLFYEKSVLPSLFIKPSRFSVEEELRLVFEMPRDVPEVLRINDKDLLKYIEIIR